MEGDTMETQQVRTGISIRPFEDRDYEAIVAIRNAVLPDRPTTVEEFRYDDEHFDKKFVNERYVAVGSREDTIRGYGELWHVPWAFHPRKFIVDVRVHPGTRRQGIGTGLWAHLEERLRAHQAISVKTQIWEKMPDGLAFARARGFREVMRAWESRLDVSRFDFGAFEPAVDGALRSGVTITTLGVERAKDPGSLRRIHTMDMEISADVPHPPDDVHTPVDFKMWKEYVADAPWSINDAFFLAVVDGEYAGLSSLFKPKVGDWLNQGLTGVRRQFRGRHIATALKVKTAEYARDHGIREIRTWNEINNAPMLAINIKFGFVRQPAWLTFAKEYQGG